MGWIGVDLDGTLAEHYWPAKGEYDPYRIGDPVPAMVERVKRWLAEGQEVRIFTARVGPHGSAPVEVLPPDGEDVRRIRNEIFMWTLEHVGVGLEATCVKDYAMIELWDDRAVRVVLNTGARCCLKQGSGSPAATTAN